MAACNLAPKSAIWYNSNKVRKKQPAILHQSLQFWYYSNYTKEKAASNLSQNSTQGEECAQQQCKGSLQSQNTKIQHQRRSLQSQYQNCTALTMHPAILQYQNTAPAILYYQMSRGKWIVGGLHSWSQRKKLQYHQY